MMQNGQEMLRVVDTYIKLSFEKEPDELSFSCWPHEDWASGEAESHVVNGFEGDL